VTNLPPTSPRDYSFEVGNKIAIGNDSNALKKPIALGLDFKVKDNNNIVIDA